MRLRLKHPDENPILFLPTADNYWVAVKVQIFMRFYLVKKANQIELLL